MPATAINGCCFDCGLSPTGAGHPVQFVDRKIRPGHFHHHVVVSRKDRVRRDQRVERLAQPTGGKRDGILHILAADDHQINVAIELEVLKPVVEDVNGGAEMFLGESARPGNGRRTSAPMPGQLPRQHQRFVARARSARMPSGSRTTTTPRSRDARRSRG